MRSVQVFLCALLLGYGVLAVAPAAIAAGASSMIPKERLQEKLTVAEAEASQPGINDDRLARFPDAGKPFGFRHREWEEFKAAMLPGDELRAFSSPADSWAHLAGRAGFALVRHGVPIKVT